MHESFFLTAGLALLMFFDKPAKGRASARAMTSVPAYLAAALDLFWLVLLLLTFYFFAFGLWAGPGPADEWASLFFMIGAFGITGARGKSGVFWGVVAGLTVFIYHEKDVFRWGPAVIRSVVLVSQLVFFRFLIEGLRERLLFSRPARWLAGAPLLLVSAALLALIWRPFLK